MSQRGSRDFCTKDALAGHHKAVRWFSPQGSRGHPRCQAAGVFQGGGHLAGHAPGPVVPWPRVTPLVGCT